MYGMGKKIMMRTCFYYDDYNGEFPIVISN
jgi:hypothetical protein